MCLEMTATLAACDTEEEVELGAPAALTKAARRRVRQRLRKKLGKAMAAAEEEDDFMQLQQLQDSLRQPQPLQHLQQLQEQLRRPQNAGGLRRTHFEQLPMLELPAQQHPHQQQKGEEQQRCTQLHPGRGHPATATLLPQLPSCQIPLVNKYIPIAAWVPEPEAQMGGLPYHQLVTICAVQNVRQLDEVPRIDTMDIVLNLPSRAQKHYQPTPSETTADAMTTDKSESGDSDDQGIRSWASTPIPVARTFIHFEEGAAVETARQRSRSV